MVTKSHEPPPLLPLPPGLLLIFLLSRLRSLLPNTSILTATATSTSASTFTSTSAFSFTSTSNCITTTSFYYDYAYCFGIAVTFTTTCSTTCGIICGTTYNFTLSRDFVEAKAWQATVAPRSYFQLRIAPFDAGPKGIDVEVWVGGLRTSGAKMCGVDGNKS